MSGPERREQSRTDRPRARASKFRRRWKRRGEWREGISPPRSLRTGRDTLASSGSHCSAASIEQAPVSEKPRLMACDARHPVSGSPLVPAQGLELSGRPSRQDQIDVPQGWIESRRTEPPVVVDPTDRGERVCAGCGTERDAHSSGSFAHHPRPKRVAEKVELKSRIVFTSTFISAIDDFRQACVSGSWC